jgi:hypothetical protein
MIIFFVACNTRIALHREQRGETAGRRELSPGRDIYRLRRIGSPFIPFYHGSVRSFDVEPSSHYYRAQ